MIGQCFAIAQDMSSEQWKQAADLIVEPDVNGFDYDSFEHTTELIQAGEVAMRCAMPEVKKWLEVPTAAPGSARSTTPTLPRPAALPAD